MRPGALLAVLALATTAAAPVPRRVVSLNLCTDELALLLAAPGQLASVSRLGADLDETTLAERAAGLPLNDGRIESVLRLRPDLILTGGGLNRYAAEMAMRLKLRVVEVSAPQSLADLRRNVRTVARALGRAAAGESLIARVDTNLGVQTATMSSALFVGGGGTVPRSNGLTAALLRRAGLVEQRVPQGQISLERLLRNPPQVLVLTRYRSGQYSLNQTWLTHPALRRLPAATRVLTVDGRAWTCAGPLVAGEVAKLRTALSSGVAR